MQLNGHEILLLLQTLALAGVAVSVVAKILKKIFKGHLDDDIHKVVLVLSALAGYAQYIDQFHAVLPPYVLGISATAIYGFSQLTYKGSKASISFLNKVQANADGKPAPVDAPPAPEPPVTPTAGTEATF